MKLRALRPDHQDTALLSILELCVAFGSFWLHSWGLFWWLGPERPREHMLKATFPLQVALRSRQGREWITRRPRSWGMHVTTLYLNLLQADLCRCPCTSQWLQLVSFGWFLFMMKKCLLSSPVILRAELTYATENNIIENIDKLLIGWPNPKSKI